MGKWGWVGRVGIWFAWEIRVHSTNNICSRMAVFAGSQIQKLQNWQTESGGIIISGRIGYIVSAQLKCRRLHTLPFECLFTAHPAWQEHVIVNFFFYKQVVWITCSFIFNSNNLVFGYNKCRLRQHSDARKSVILQILFSWSFFSLLPTKVGTGC